MSDGLFFAPFFIFYWTFFDKWSKMGLTLTFY